MKRIASDTGFFRDGNPNTKALGTPIAASWLNGVQEELLTVIEFAGILPSSLNNAQLLEALQAIFGKAAPAGLIGHFARPSAPDGWLKANGAAVSRTSYTSLFSAIGTTFGIGDGSTTFNLPDLRAEVVRGLDDGRGIDVGRVLGSAQASQNLAHTHDGSSASAGEHTHSNDIYTRLLRPPYGGSLTGADTSGSGSEQAVGSGDSADLLAAGNHTHVITINSSGGTEARMRNIAMLACIKY